jgi:DNA transformation protein
MTEFVDYLHEVFASFGPIRARRMFGGYGIYHNDIMFALVADDVLYLKADAETVADFERLGLDVFEYARNGKPVALSYHLAPEVIFDDPDQAVRWANRAYSAAVRARRPAGKSGRNP